MKRIAGLKFPIETKTRAGTPVTLTGYYAGYDRPWVGFLEIDMVDAQFKQPVSWLEGGHYVSETIQRSLDVEVPELTRTKGQ